MDRSEMIQYLTALSEILAARGIKGELYLVGGAAMALAYDARRSTRDIDAVFAPKDEVYRAAREVAAQFDLPDAWLNDAVKGFLAGPDPEATSVLDLAGLRVLAASPRYMLAMKLLAARREDEADIRFLLRHLQIRDVDEALQAVLDVYPEAQILPRTRYIVEEILLAPGGTG
ncbi:nucleotidyl transferase AbiEii/AbiGii toxin family protein [Limnochorda pilosa]|uniref:DUF6036 domain-containing protein n=1 Tax=Limnochorda pilosa TaxID=1555112 RepID=A0A0K2SLZ0_LIMPI|nr:nucleotidyl transferase AbiEii/AbiGii toxin family protein [Limnochorda pilosa]BAS28133.1 hypothetical protein LIP_2292 [Limnochorda pilosa]